MSKENEVHVSFYGSKNAGKSKTFQGVEAWQLAHDFVLQLTAVLKNC